MAGMTVLWSCAYSQNRGNIWMIGNDYYEFHNGGEDFNSGFLDTFSLFRPMSMFLTHGMICDTNGNLLLYTNGQWIANAAHDTIKNSEHFNPGYITDTFYCSPTCYGSGVVQGALILPHPGSMTQYDIFHLSGDFINNFKAQSFNIGHSVVDMSLNNGLGEMILKDEHLIMDDTLTFGRLTACKHANGRDWWLIHHQFNTTRYYKFLITPDSIYGPFSQDIGQSIYSDNFGLACFSPDGNYYAMISPVDNHTLDIFKFDRCSGEFTDVIVSEVLPPQPTYWWLSVAFSPNNRFLYASSQDEIWQYDLQTVDVQGSKKLVATWDTLYAIFTTQFLLAQLAPDNKIYISTSGSDSLQHVINQPDQEGIACEVLQNYDGIKLPVGNVSLPNLPNYDLGALPGSPCDTLTAVGSIEWGTPTFSVQPNPASDWLNIVYRTGEDAVFELYDLYGHQVAEVQLYHYFKNRLLSVRNLPQGVYVFTIKQGSVMLKNGKVAVQH
jgi:hypothetical protein